MFLSSQVLDNNKMFLLNLSRIIDHHQNSSKHRTQVLNNIRLNLVLQALNKHSKLNLQSMVSSSTWEAKERLMAAMPVKKILHQRMAATKHRLVLSDNKCNE